MPFALVFIGMLLFITGFQNTYKELGSQVAKDFSGPGNFIYWMVAIGVIGALGYAKSLEMFSRWSLALLLIVMFLAKNGGFSQGQKFFQSIAPALDAGSKTAPLPAGGLDPVIYGGGGAGGDSGGGFNIGQAVDIATTVASFF